MLASTSSPSSGTGKIGGSRKIIFKGLRFISNNNNKEPTFFNSDVACSAWSSVLALHYLLSSSPQSRNNCLLLTQFHSPGSRRRKWWDCVARAKARLPLCGSLTWERQVCLCQRRAARASRRWRRGGVETQPVQSGSFSF